MGCRWSVCPDGVKWPLVLTLGGGTLSSRCGGGCIGPRDIGVPLSGGLGLGYLVRDPVIWFIVLYPGVWGWWD